MARSSEPSISADGNGRKEKKIFQKYHPARYWLKILFQKMREASTAFFIALQDMRDSIGMWVLEQVDIDCNLFYSSGYFVSLLSFLTCIMGMMTPT